MRHPCRKLVRFLLGIGYMTNSTMTQQIESGRRYLATLTAEQRFRLAIMMVLSAVGYRGEQTEAHVFANAEQSGIAAELVEAAIADLVDSGAIRSTVIDGKEHGFLPGLVRGVK
jgi:hypothetical protein